MKLQIKLGASKQHLIMFFSGYLKKSNWDQSEFGKELNILKQLDTYSHIQVEIEDDDYCHSI